MGKSSLELFQKLLESPVSLIIVGGLAVIILGLAGGIQYNNWLPIASGLPQISTVVIGILIFISGVVLTVIKPTSPRPYGITITSPARNEPVNVTRVEGKIRKHPPARYELWLLRMYSNGDFLPLRNVILSSGQEEWSVPDFNVGGRSGEHRIITAALVGPAGQVLFSYFSSAARRHNTWMDRLKVDGDERDRYLPNLERQMMAKVDIIECDRVDVRVR
jgi:hypothetical protein